MVFKVDDIKVFKKSLVLLKKARGNVKPVLEGLYLENHNSVLHLVVNNLNDWIRVNTGIKAEGTNMVVSKDFYDMVRKFKEGFTFEDGKIICGKFSAEVGTHPVQDYPPIIRPDEGEWKTISLKDTLGYVKEAMSKDTYMRNLHGVLWDITSKGIRLVAADGFILSTTTLDTDIPEYMTGKFLLDSLPMEILSKMDYVQFTKDTKRFIFNTGTTEICTKILEFDFPNYEKVLPTVFSAHGYIDRDEFLSVLSFYNKDDIIKLTFGENIFLQRHIPIEKSVSYGDPEAYVDVEEPQGTMEVSYGVTLMKVLVKSFDAGSIYLQFTGGTGPLQMTQGNKLSVIMPVRTS